MGSPDPAYISTSYVERQNLNIRMQNRRYTRLTNAFSKKADMLAYSIAIMFMYHNFVRIHQTLKSTPAMKAGTYGPQVVNRRNGRFAAAESAEKTWSLRPA